MYLLYCILLNDATGTNTQMKIPGIDGKAVHEICCNGIAGVVSVLDTVPDTKVKTLLAYNDVIAAYHQHRTVIPLRFGAFFKERSHMMTALKNNEKIYLMKLEKLHGCTEMCIRFIAPFPRVGRVEKKEMKGTCTKRSGTDFLMQRKKIYEQHNLLPPELHQLSARILTHLDGIYREYKQEVPSREKAADTLPGHENERLVSLFFLISKEQLALFRSRFTELRKDLSIKTVMSGPWPPFTFVDTESDLSFHQQREKS